MTMAMAADWYFITYRLFQLESLFRHFWQLFQPRQQDVVQAQHKGSGASPTEVPP
jgi:hypothetical protein